MKRKKTKNDYFCAILFMGMGGFILLCGLLMILH